MVGSWAVCLTPGEYSLRLLSAQIIKLPLQAVSANERANTSSTHMHSHRRIKSDIIHSASIVRIYTFCTFLPTTWNESNQVRTTVYTISKNRQKLFSFVTSTVLSIF